MIAVLTSSNIRSALQALNCLQRLMLDARVRMSGGGLKRVPCAPVADFPQCLNCRLNNVSVIGLSNERNQCINGFAFMPFAQNPCGAHLCGRFWIAQRDDVFVNVIRLHLLRRNVLATKGTKFCGFRHRRPTICAIKSHGDFVERNFNTSNAPVIDSTAL